MDKIKQNIDLQEAIQRYNIEKSVVGTLAYNIDQNLQKGMSVDEAIENVLQKAGGEGSRGGKVIGHTKSGKPIYEGKMGQDEIYRDYSEQDHFDAADLHKKEYKGKAPLFMTGMDRENVKSEDSHRYVATVKRRGEGHKLYHTQKSFEDTLQKSKSMPIGTIHNGFKKIAEGKWRKVSTSEMTKEEHEAQASHHNEQRVKNPSEKDGKGSWHLSQENSHKRVASNLDSKDYSDEEVTGGEKKEDIKEIYSLIDKLTPGEKFEILAESGHRPTSGSRYFYSDEDKGTDRVYKMKGDLSNEELISRINHKINQRDRVQKLPFKKSQSESTLSKSEQTEAQKAKVKKVVEEFNKGILKSSAGELITDRSEALRFALLEAGIEIQKSGEGSRGGKVIGHTKSGKPVYEKSQNLSYNSFTKQDHLDAAEHHNFEKRRAEDALENSKDFNKRKLLKEKINSHSENEKGHIVRAERSKN